jgi:hypothetical protein
VRNVRRRTEAPARSFGSGEFDVDVRPPDLADLIDNIWNPEALACPTRIDPDQHAQARPTQNLGLPSYV